jgi:hypothetical protein
MKSKSTKHDARNSVRQRSKEGAASSIDRGYGEILKRLEDNPAAGLEALTKALSFLSIERAFAQDQESLSRLRSWASKLIAGLPGETPEQLAARVTPGQSDSNLSLGCIKAARESIDVSRFPELRSVKEFIDTFFSRQPPRPLDCIDVVEISSRKAEALLDNFG